MNYDMKEYNKMNYDIKILKRFWSKVTIPDDYIQQCWLWTGKLNDRGYGSIFILGKQTRVHRFVYECYNGPIPNGLLVRHTCDIRNCVNPNHLLTGTSQDNVNDMINRNRIAHGEKQGISILTEHDVKFILNALLNNSYSSQQLAKIYNVKRATINGISRGKSWKRVYNQFSDNEKEKIRYNVSNNAGNSRVISPQDVILMRDIYKNNKISYSKIAKQFGIATMTAYNIINKKSWAHV